MDNREVRFLTEVLDYLKNNKNYRREVALCKKSGIDCAAKEDKLNFLDWCLTQLDSYERNLITALCMDGVSIRHYANVSGFSRYFVAKERDRVLEMLERYFKIRFL